MLFFHPLILFNKFYFIKISVCKNQGIANIKKAHKLDTNIIIQNLNKNIASIKKTNTSTTNIAAKNINIGIVCAIEVVRV